MYKLTLTRNSDTSVLNKENAVKFSEIKILANDLYVPRFTPSISQQTILSKQILGKLPTELQYVERSVLMEEIITQSLWSS